MVDVTFISFFGQTCSFHQSILLTEMMMMKLMSVDLKSTQYLETSRLSVKALEDSGSSSCGFKP